MGALYLVFLGKLLQSRKSLVAFRKDDGILLILHSALQQLNLYAWSFASWYRVHRGHIFTIEVLRVSESGGQTKGQHLRNRFALIIAFTFLDRKSTRLNSSHDQI